MARRVLKKWNGRLLSHRVVKVVSRLNSLGVASVSMRFRSHRVVKVVSGLKDWPRGSVPSRDGQVFVGAYSVADARELWLQAFGCEIPTSEIRNYWHKNCWGNSMDGVPFERGIWVVFNRHGANTIGPLRVI